MNLFLCFRLYLGVFSHGELHQTHIPTDLAHRSRLQSRWKHCMQVFGREPGQSGQGVVLCQCLSGILCSQVGLDSFPIVLWLKKNMTLVLILLLFISSLYSVLRAHETFLQWDQCRRIYNFFMADNMKKIIFSHQ